MCTYAVSNQLKPLPRENREGPTGVDNRHTETVYM